MVFRCYAYNIVEGEDFVNLVPRGGLSRYQKGKKPLERG